MTDITALLAGREALRPTVEPFLEPGEHLQIVVKGRGRPAAGVMMAAAHFWPFISDKARYLLVATDRAWLVLEGRQGWRAPFRLRYRGPRDIRIDISWSSRFDGFDQPYAIDPFWQDQVHAANDALDAAQQGRPWDLADAGARLGTAPRDAVSDGMGLVVGKVNKFLRR